MSEAGSDPEQSVPAKLGVDFDSSSKKAANKDEGDRRKAGPRNDRRQTDRRNFQRRKTWQIPAFLSFMLIASLSLGLLLVVYSWQAAKDINLETQIFGESSIDNLTKMSGASLESLMMDNGGTVLVSLQKHPNFRYLIIETAHGQRLAMSSNGDPELAVPVLPLSVNQRIQNGHRDFKLSNGSTLSEYYGPVTDVRDRVLRLGMYKPDFYWPQSAFYYLLMSLPLILLTLAALSALFTTYMPIKLLSNHFKRIKDSKQLSGIDNSSESSPLLEHFNELVSNTKIIISEIEMKQDSLQLNSKVLNFDKQRAESVINTLPHGVLVLDSTGLKTFCNVRMQRFFPQLTSSGKEAVFKDWCQVPEVVEYINRHLKNPGNSNMESLDFKYGESSKSSKVASVTALAIVGRAGEEDVLGSLFVFQDVSSIAESKKSSEEFVINVAHELKTPLHVIKMYSETLMEDDLEPALRIESVNTIYDEVDRMASLVNNLLNIAKIEIGDISLDRTRIKLADFLNDIFDTMQRSSSNPQLVLEKNIPEGLSAIVADKELLRVAINNLLSNAIKYSGDQGLVVLAAEETADHIIISVADSGPGISSDDQLHIFEKFYRSENDQIRQKTGHGLGLTLSRNIIQLHHGSLVVDSELGDGSKFTVAFNKKFNIMEKVSG
jgi:signal transduction histidine kinase